MRLASAQADLLAPCDNFRTRLGAAGKRVTQSAKFGILALVGFCTGSQADEFALFRMTGMSGYVASGFQFDEYFSRQPGFAGTQMASQRLLQSDLRTEAYIVTQSYIYHPKFLSVDVSGGPVFLAARAEGDGASNRSKEHLYNLSARVSALSDKPVRGMVFYEHLNPTISVSPGETFTQQASKYGFAVSALAPLSPVPATIEGTRAKTHGKSATRVLDEQIDRATLRLERTLGRSGLTQFAYSSLDQASSSGSTTLPIQYSRQRSNSFTSDTRLQLGKDRQFEINNNIVYSNSNFALEQGRTPKLEEFRFSLNYAGRHSAEWQTFGNYQLSDNRQDDKSTITNSAYASVAWVPSRSSTLGAGVRGNDARAPQFSTRSAGADVSLRHEQALPLGNLQTSYSARLDLRDQSAGLPRPTVIGERITLTGTTASKLGQARVTAGSVVVQNVTRTQTYVEGIDYLLTVVGEATRIQIILSGLILDGETVLIDYSFDVGGSYSSTHFEQGISVNWALARALNVYGRYNDSTPRVTAGTPTAPLNAIRSTVFGLRSEFPLGRAEEYVVGGYIEHERHDETIAPFLRTAAEAFVQGELPFLGGTSFRAGARRTKVEADNVFQGVNLAGYDLILGMQVGRGFRITATGLFENDTGGFEHRSRRSAVLKAIWRFRQLSFSMDVSRILETQGAAVRERTFGRINLRRDL